MPAPDWTLLLRSPAFETTALLLGLVVGSFANVCIHRLPRRESVVSPPSRCPSCGSLIRARDNVPLVSWLLLHGRCRACRAPISPRYPAVEAANGLLWLALAALRGPGAQTFVTMALVTALLVLSFIDFDHQLLPDVVTLPGIVAGLAASFRPA
jgi:leader peptidase (prepilin peptidase)/N-methyltransferase